MKKLICGFLGILAICGSAYSMDDELLPVDTSDPLYMLSNEHVLSTTSVDYGNDILRLGQAFSYGANDRFNMGANVHYQFDFVRDRKETGFSSIELSGVYRSGAAESNSAGVSSDVLFGAKFAGNRNVREPDFAKSTYFAGLRFGRQWAGVSLSGTVKSTWIFDNANGMAFLDFIPEAYFRMVDGWRLGFGLTARVATDPGFDREWLKVKVIHQFGRTQYGAVYSYEYEREDSAVGAYVNILF